MSTPFYDLASLVLVPSGYKSQKVYAQKPLTTDGQLTFSRASTATRVNSAGLIETVASNVPRLDYLGSTCPKLLLEPQRTNLVTNSENLGGAGWSAQGSTITSNATTSPDGYSNADAIVETATTDEHNRIFNTTLTAASHTASVFLKKFNQTWCALYLFNGTVGIRHWINLDTLTAGTSANIGAGIAAPLTLTNYGNGWVRASMTWTADATAWSFYIACARSNGGATTYAGDGTSGLYAWGAQVEAGAYATSYIPTLGAAVTRLADACSKTGISSLIGQTEGTLFGEVVLNDNSVSTAIRLRNSATGLYNDTIALEFSDTRQPQVITLTSGVTQVNIVGTALSTGTHKIAFAYKLNDFALYADGVQIGTSSSGTVPIGMNEIYIDQFIDGGIRNASQKQTLLFKTRLTNAQLAELTAL